MLAGRYMALVVVRYSIVLFGILVSSYASIILWPFPLEKPPENRGNVSELVAHYSSLTHWLYGYILWCLFSGLLLLFVIGPLIRGHRIARIVILITMVTQGLALVGFSSASGRSGVLIALGAVPSIICLIVAIRIGNGRDDATGNNAR